MKRNKLLNSILSNILLRCQINTNKCLYKYRLGIIILLLAIITTLLFYACMPPIAYHDGLPAYTPQNNHQEFRVGCHRISHSEFGGEDWYFNGGWRMGFAPNDEGFNSGEFGINSVFISEASYAILINGLIIGGSTSSPQSNLRLTLYPVAVTFDEFSGTEFHFLSHYYQLSYLIGSNYKSRGFNVALGGRTSPTAIGPVIFAEYIFNIISIRAEASLMFPPPFEIPYIWVPPEFVFGRTLTLGLVFSNSPSNHREQADYFDFGLYR